MFWCFGKKPRNYHCKIVLLDETEFIQEIQETSRGQQLLDVVFKHLNLMETAYFGLRFLDSTGQRHWLDPNKSIVKQMKDIETFTFYFGVKFYASDPCKLLEEITRYQFFLQVKQDIYQGRLPLTYDLAAELFAYAIQSELGDYDPRRHLPGYAAEFNFTANQTIDLESKAAEIHKGLCGTVPAVAELNFLDRIKWLDMYGVDLHTVLGEDSIEYFLGLTPSGILVLRNKTKVGNYFWPRITKVYYKRKYFMIRVRDKNNEESTYGFELPSKKACKHLWKCCSEHRAFFKLTQVREVPGQSGKIVGLENKFYGKNFQALSMQSRLRTPPTFVRVPSRRFHKRLGQPDGADAKTQTKEEGNAKHILEPTVAMPIIPHNPILIPALHRSTSVPSVVPSPYKIVPAPWEDPRLSNRGLYSSGTNPSPRSVRSAGALPSRRYPLHGRTGSIESTASYDYRKRKHHHSRRQSDNESEVSKSSRCSKSSKASRHSHRRHGSQSGGDGSDSETQHRHRRHSRRKKHGSTYELVDSEGQWKEIQRQQEQSQARMQNAVVRDLSKRRSGYMNSGLETESETNYSHRRRHRRHRSRSKSPDSKNVIPHEVKRYIDYNLVDPTTLTEEEKRDIKYTKIQADSRLFKIRYSSSQGQLHGNPTRMSNGSLHKIQSLDDPGPPPPYSTDQQNGFLPQSQQRLVDIEEKNESPTENVHISKICTSSPQSSSTSTSSNKARYGGNSSPMVQSPKHTSSQEWNISKSSLSLNRSQVAPETGITPQRQENDQILQPDHAGKSIRLVNGHFYPASQKSLVTMPTMTHRVTFQNDDASKQYPKTFTSSQSWTQSSPRQNGEVPKSTEAKPSQNSHEMSTEL